VFDERDEMDDDMVTLAEERVSSSKIQQKLYLGTPTIPDYGVDKLYQKSDQRVWMLSCRKCGRETCLELEFPDCLRRNTDGTVIRICIHCGAEVYPVDGHWVPLYPDRSKDLVGWWISQLNSTYINPKTILELYEDPPHGDLSEVMNSKLGMAYIPAENRLTRQDVYNRCGQDAMTMNHEGPCFMGVDVGKELNVVIGINKTRTQKKILKVCRVSSFNDLHDLARDYGVKCAVIDLKPEIRKVREFQRQENFQVWACDYVETRTGMTSWDEKDKIIKCNRTEICDASHNLVTSEGSLELPRRNTELDVYARQMCNMAKVLVEDERTGTNIYRYKKLDSMDHYRHATNYALLASERCGVYSDQSIIGRYFSRRRKRTAWTA
jgi:hypothetical protein